MEKSKNNSIEDYLNRFTMIVGDVNSGKTALTQKILVDFCNISKGRVTVVDLAPDIDRADSAGKDHSHAVGGRLHIPGSGNVDYYHTWINAPRLRSRDEKHAEALATKNKNTIEVLFEKALRKKTDALFVNDCSLYLHAGSPVQFLEWVHSCKTAVVNGYLGGFFGESLISTRERAGMQYLMHQCDRLIRK
jgi:hypothetical protein